MTEINCGKVTVEERDEIRKLFQRKNALTELFGSFSKLDDITIDKLYNRLIEDMGKTTTDFHNWWDQKAKQYSWQFAEGATWRIDFDTCEVFLTRK
jgi:CXXX repeat modification system protein